MEEVNEENCNINMSFSLPKNDESVLGEVSLFGSCLQTFYLCIYY